MGFMAEVGDHGFLTELDVRCLRIEGAPYLLLAPLTYRLREPIQLASGEWLYELTVPAGYQTDFASVPQILWAMFPRDGVYRDAAVVHDHIYTDLCDRITKAQADRIFREACLALGTPEWQANIMYDAVCNFGEGGW